MQHPETHTTTLTIRNIDIALKQRLRERAALHGHSMEAELRYILSEALEVNDNRLLNLAESIRQRFTSFGGVELEAHPPVRLEEPPAFDV